MKESKSFNVTYTGRLIAKNTIYNLVGYGLPLIFAIAVIPSLIKGLGQERFGILSLVWVIIGYFSFFDFGIGRALTKIMAEKVGIRQIENLPSLFWTSFLLILVLGLICTITFSLLTPVLVYKFLNISEDLQTETLNTFYILALSIPIITITAGLRGVLEAYQKFGIINIIRTILGVFLFLGPLLCLIFTKSLFWIVLFLIFIRVVILGLYLYQSFKLAEIKNKLHFRSDLVKPILKLSGWMTVSNITVPILVYSDRFLIGAFVSAASIAYYTTPYEIVTKLLLIPGALIGVLFPAFSANYLNKPEFTKKILLRAIKYVFILLFPIVILTITFASEGLDLWLGKKFAEQSSLILQILAAGVLFNSLAYIPFAFLQGIGRPDITAKVSLVELPIYFVLLWLAIRYGGIKGVALVCFSRMVIDALILLIFTKKIISAHFELRFKFIYLFILLLIIALVFTILISTTSFKLVSVSIIFLTFIFISWKFLLLEEEKVFLISRLKIFNS